MISADIMTRSMSEVLGWPLLNFVWQGALIASISAILFALCRNARPQLRYLIACIAMLLCLLWSVLSIIQQWQAPQAVSLEAALQMAANTAISLYLVSIRESAFAASIETYLPLIVSAWSLGVMVMMLRLGLGLLWVHKLGAQHDKGRLAESSSTWQRRANQLAPRLRIGGDYHFQVSNTTRESEHMRVHRNPKRHLDLYLAWKQNPQSQRRMSVSNMLQQDSVDSDTYTTPTARWSDNSRQQSARTWHLAWELKL